MYRENYFDKNFERNPHYERHSWQLWCAESRKILHGNIDWMSQKTAHFSLALTNFFERRSPGALFVWKEHLALLEKRAPLRAALTHALQTLDCNIHDIRNCCLEIPHYIPNISNLLNTFLERKFPWKLPPVEKLVNFPPKNPRNFHSLLLILITLTFFLRFTQNLISAIFKAFWLKFLSAS